MTTATKSIFETHIGFPKQLTATFDAVIASGSIWSPLNFGRIVRAKDSERFDAHDVPEGIGYLATANSSCFSEAMRLAVTARQLIGANNLVRVEIEEIIGVDSLKFVYDDQRPRDITVPDGFHVISDFPGFESHISVKRSDQKLINDLDLEREFLETGHKFNEFAVTGDDKKGIFTMFFDNAEDMSRETAYAARGLKRQLPKDCIIKASVERILFCASL